jgi:hypothetical protein
MLDLAYREAYGKGLRLMNTPIDNTFIESMMEEPSAKTSLPHIIPNIIKEQPEKIVNKRSARFHVGDSVVVYPQKKIGIVFQEADDKGEIGVQIQKKKQFINHKRLQLKIASSELYPDNYDLSVVLDSVSNRKARKKMEKSYRPDLEIVYDKVKK